MIIGFIKHCSNCGKDSYVKAENFKCPECGKGFNEIEEKRKSPEVICFLGVNELNRRSVVEMRRRNMIDDF